jgi:hypothetical protein
VDEWWWRKSAAFELGANSTARRAVQFNLWGRWVPAYANANLSIYSDQKCNAACHFCVEELRPLWRGGELVNQKSIETDDERYFESLRAVLVALTSLAPTIAITGGEPSKDPRLPRILREVSSTAAPKRTLTTNVTSTAALQYPFLNRDAEQTEDRAECGSVRQGWLGRRTRKNKDRSSAAIITPITVPEANPIRTMYERVTMGLRRRCQSQSGSLSSM